MAVQNKDTRMQNVMVNVKKTKKQENHCFTSSHISAGGVAEHSVHIKLNMGLAVNDLQ